jgi:DNA-directed RNA polymerase subunit E'/Rpb7
MSFQDEIVEKILVPPHNLDNDLSEHILDILKKKYLNKCTKQGYIIKIIKILKRSSGEVSMLDFDGNTSYVVKFLAEISLPKEGEIIKDCAVTLVNQIGIFAEKDFLSIIITSSLLEKGYEKKFEGKKKINVEVNKIKYELNDKKIRVLGKVV